MRPLIVPLLQTADTHERIARPVIVDSSVEHYLWPVGRNSPRPHLSHCADAADALAAIPQQARRIVYWSNFACVETMPNGTTAGHLDGGTLDAERAALTGRIDPGPARVSVTALVNGCRRLGVKPNVVIVNCESGTTKIVEWLRASSRDMPARRRIPDARVGAAMRNAPDPHDYAANAIFAEYAAGIVSTLCAETLRSLAALGSGVSIALSVGSVWGGSQPWVVPSPFGAPITPWPIPTGFWNAPQLYQGNVAADEVGLGGHMAWASLLMFLDALRANVAAGTKLVPIFAPPAWPGWTDGQTEIWYAHAARTMGAPPIVPLWNQKYDYALGREVDCPPGQVALAADLWASACIGTSIQARDTRRIDYAAPSVQSGDFLTTRDAFEALGSN